MAIDIASHKKVTVTFNHVGRKAKQITSQLVVSNGKNINNIKVKDS
jgi:hypothetical protein